MVDTPKKKNPLKRPEFPKAISGDALIWDNDQKKYVPSSESLKKIPRFLDPEKLPQDQPGFETDKPKKPVSKEKKKAIIDKDSEGKRYKVTPVNSQAFRSARKKVINSMISQGLTWEQGFSLFESLFNMDLSRGAAVNFADEAMKAGFDPGGKAFETAKFPESHSDLRINWQYEQERIAKNKEVLERPPDLDEVKEQERRARRSYTGTVNIAGHVYNLDPSEEEGGTRRHFNNYNEFAAAKDRGEVIGRPEPDGKGGLFGIIASSSDDIEVSGPPVTPSSPTAEKVRNAVIPHSTITLFRDAMINVMEGVETKKYTKRDNFFKRVVEEIRKTSPKIRMEELQDMKDYLYFKGILEADIDVSDKTSPSRISNMPVPEYVRPSALYYKDGLSMLDDTINSNEPLFISKDQDPLDLPPKEVKEKKSKLSSMIRKGVTYGSKSLGPFIAVGAGAATLVAPTSAEARRKGANPEMEALLGLFGMAPTATARSAFSEIEEDKIYAAAEREQLIPTDMEERGARQAARRETMLRKRKERQAPYERAFMEQ
tara:strand:- start:2217 stop:3845 length:1629 start_codon:yes stop_codon:yes gene_type:complete